MPRSSNPITMTFPPFAGIVRTLVFANVGIFFAVAILQWLAPAIIQPLLMHLLLTPSDVAHGQLWQLITYSFLHFGILEILFAMMTLWFCGSLLEGAYGTRWLRDLYIVSAVEGAVIAAVISFTGILHLSPNTHSSGSWAAIYGILIAIAMRMGDTEFMLFPLPFRIQAKYMVGIYILIDTALLLKDANAFAALLHLSGALSGYLYVKFAPSRGLGFGLSERLYGMRNSYYRYKRRRAARKFEVYMGKQGRKVHFDSEGRYIDPDEHRDPNDKRWMN
jgi:membrane associated rhomboid family serine protease